MNPKITVLLPTYNCGHFIEEAIESILNQTFLDYEVLIVDDGSKDGTADIVAKYLVHPNIKYFYKENTGLGDTLNFAIKLARGKYLVRMDSDDICLSDRFEKLYDIMEQNEDWVACGSYVSYFMKDPSQEKIYQRKFPIEPDKILNGLLNLAHVLCHPSLIIRKEAAVSVGGYQIKGVGEDWDFFLQLSKTGKIGNYPKCLYLMRMNPNSITHTKWEECFINNNFAVLRYKNNLSITELHDFKQKFKNQKLKRVLLYLDSKSLNLYRQGLKYYLTGQKSFYYRYIILASLVSPMRVINRLKNMLIR